MGGKYTDKTNNSFLDDIVPLHFNLMGKSSLWLVTSYQINSFKMWPVQPYVSHLVMGSSLKWIIESCLRFVPCFSFTQCKNWWSTKGRTTGSVIRGMVQNIFGHESWVILKRVHILNLLIIKLSQYLRINIIESVDWTKSSQVLCTHYAGTLQPSVFILPYLF